MHSTGVLKDPAAMKKPGSNVHCASAEEPAAEEDPVGQLMHDVASLYVVAWQVWHAASEPFTAALLKVPGWHAPGGELAVAHS